MTGPLARRPYRILVTGSRDWTDEWTVEAAVHDALRAADRLDEKYLTPVGAVVIVHGACPTGADHIADEWAICSWATPEPHPADWSGPCHPDYCRPGHRRRRGGDTSTCPTAGFRRNAQMVLTGADVCLAFINPCVKTACRKPRPHGSHGATHCVGLAEKAGIQTVRYLA